MQVPASVLAASIGVPDTLLLMLLALVVFGPRRLPEIGRQIGKLMYEFRKISNDFKLQMEEELRVSQELEVQRKRQAIATEPNKEPDLPLKPTDVGKSGAEVQPEAIRRNELEANHA